MKQSKAMRPTLLKRLSSRKNLPKAPTAFHQNPEPPTPMPPVPPMPMAEPQSAFSFSSSEPSLRRRIASFRRENSTVRSEARSEVASSIREDIRPTISHKHTFLKRIASFNSLAPSEASVVSQTGSRTGQPRPKRPGMLQRSTSMRSVNIPAETKKHERLKSPDASPAPVHTKSRMRNGDPHDLTPNRPFRLEGLRPSTYALSLQYCPNYAPPYTSLRAWLYDPEMPKKFRRFGPDHRELKTLQMYRWEGLDDSLDWSQKDVTDSWYKDGEWYASEYFSGGGAGWDWYWYWVGWEEWVKGEEWGEKRTKWENGEVDEWGRPPRMRGEMWHGLQEMWLDGRRI